MITGITTSNCNNQDKGGEIFASNKEDDLFMNIPTSYIMLINKGRASIKKKAGSKSGFDITRYENKLVVRTHHTQRSKVHQALATTIDIC